MPSALAHSRTSTAFRSPPARGGRRGAACGQHRRTGPVRPQFPSVPGVQVDLILGAAQPEVDGTLGGAAVEVIDEQGLYLLSDGRPGPLTGLQRISVCSLAGARARPLLGFRPGPSW
jgi:hypothetical protein